MDKKIISRKIKTIKERNKYKPEKVIPLNKRQEILKMSSFIDAVRAWSNQENPDPWDGSLENITIIN